MLRFSSGLPVGTVISAPESHQKRPLHVFISCRPCLPSWNTSAPGTITRSTSHRIQSMSIECQDERRSRLLDALPAIAWSAAVPSFRFTYINPAAEKLLGYPAERWLNDPHFWTDHLHPEDQHVALFCHDETLCCRDHELVYRMIAADGRTVWLRDYVNVHAVDGVPV